MVPGTGSPETSAEGFYKAHVTKERQWWRRYQKKSHKRRLAMKVEMMKFIETNDKQFERFEGSYVYSKDLPDMPNDEKVRVWQFEEPKKYTIRLAAPGKKGPESLCPHTVCMVKQRKILTIYTERGYYQFFLYGQEY